jgi:hypothetical protein
MIAKPCKQCGTVFQCPPHRFPATAKSEKKFCSPSCVLAHRHSPETRAALFWAKVQKTDRCWLYMGFRKWDGYGWVGRCTNLKTRYMTAHRYAWILTNGEPPEGAHILHTCDNPPCCNPAHLQLGTHQENMADMASKRRHAYGDRQGNRKLNSRQVAEIRRRHAEGESNDDLAAEYGVRPNHISGIISGRYWAIKQPALPQPTVRTARPRRQQ